MKYKQLRNRVQNGDRITKAENDGETWRVVNDIINPKTSNNITIRTENGEISAEKEVAEVFLLYQVGCLVKL